MESKNEKILDDFSSKLIEKDGNTNLEIEINDLDKKLLFKLNKKRKIDRKTVNLIKNNDISTIIT